jgi:alpha-L-rhamnosidase
VTKRTLNVCAILLTAFATGKIVVCQTAAEPAVRKKWSAEWISHPTAALREPGVFHFRKVINLPLAPERFVIHVSADNRFVLFVNGRRVGEGPARGNFFRWRYEIVDLAPFLSRGDNVIAATVWQYGIYAPVAQITDRLAFLVEGDTRAEEIVNTDSSWEVEEERGHTVIPPMPESMHQYWAAGPGERIDGTEYDWTWKEAGSSPNAHWTQAVGAIRELPGPHGSIPGYRLEDAGTKWLLTPDLLPAMEYRQVPTGTVVRTDLEAAKSFPAKPVTIPAHSSVTILIDHAAVLSAYPELEISGGRGADIRMAFTEALYDSKQERGNRNDIADRTVVGLSDEFLPDGGQHRTFRPLWWRTWRYVELKIVTGAESLALEAFHSYYTAYPFEERGQFAASDTDLARIREICWRTARLDAHETYMDTAYWEQLQYIGDTRIQALISYVVSGDDRLARQALQAFDDSRIPEGITQSRYPSSLAQYIPTFSLLYVNMLHDYWMYRPDRKFVAELLPGTRAVLEWFLTKQRPDGMLSSIPGWVFIDWVRDANKFPPEDREGRSAIVTLQMVSALEAAADLEQALGDAVLAQSYRRHARTAAKAVYKLCWDPRFGLLADTPGKDSYSQHANIAAVLSDVIPKAEQQAVLQRILESGPHTQGDSLKLVKASLFYRFYLARALDHAGMGDRYLELLQPWREMLEKGLTTTPEFGDPTRSDTHAWSAHPLFDLPTLVAGIRPASPGFGTVQIEPALGDLQWVEASIPHPRGGTIMVKYERTRDGTNATVTLPDGLQGALMWKGKSYPLKSGEQRLSLP